MLTCFVILLHGVLLQNFTSERRNREEKEKIPCWLIWGSTQECSGDPRQRLLKVGIFFSMCRTAVGRLWGKTEAPYVRIMFAIFKQNAISQNPATLDFMNNRKEHLLDIHLLAFFLLISLSLCLSLSFSFHSSFHLSLHLSLLEFCSQAGRRAFKAYI